jgi:hypothetical protein
MIKGDEAPLEDLSLRFQTFYGTFKKGGLDSFGCNYRLQIQFDHIHYTILISEFDPKVNNQNIKKIFRKLYSEPLTKIEMETISSKLVNAIADHIEYYMKPENRKKAKD